jgi:hypothetical protein
MGNKKGYVPSEATRQKVSEALKKAHAEGRHRGNGFENVDSEEWRHKISDGLKQAYAEGRKTLTGAALANSLAPKKSEEERKARKLVTQRIWREKNPEVMAGYKQKYTPENYGLTVDQYQAQVLAQNNLCAICKGPQQGDCNLAIDHNHECCPERQACEKCRRGLLCTNCNNALGRVHDSIEILQSMLLYLQHYKKV